MGVLSVGPIVQGWSCAPLHARSPQVVHRGFTSRGLPVVALEQRSAPRQRRRWVALGAAAAAAGAAVGTREFRRSSGRREDFSRDDAYLDDDRPPRRSSRGYDSGPRGYDSGPRGYDSGPRGYDSGPRGYDSGEDIGEGFGEDGPERRSPPRRAPGGYDRGDDRRERRSPPRQAPRGGYEYGDEQPARRPWSRHGEDDYVISSERPERHSPPRPRSRPTISGPSVQFGDLTLRGAAAKFLQAQEQLTGKALVPTPIQESAVLPIYEGESVVLHAPTGTGKSLAFLLPLLQRLEEEAWRAPRSGLRLLILVPTADLQMQICGLARALVGPSKAGTVCMLRRDMDNTAVRGMVVVATPRQIIGLLEDQTTVHVWGPALGGLDMVVVDEADRLVAKWNNHQRKKRHRDGFVDPCIRVLNKISEETGKMRRRSNWQLVAASATVNRRTLRNLSYSSGVELRLIREEGATFAGGDSVSMGQYVEGPSSWPEGMMHTMRVVTPFRFNNVMTVISDTIVDLGAKRVLLALAADTDKILKSQFGLNPCTGMLRVRLEQHKFKVDTCSSAVEAATEMWVASGQTKVKDKSQREVIVGTREAIRGIHLDDIDAVIVLGDPVSVNEYLHCAGRTCRYQPELGKPTGGTVVTVCPENVADRMVKWGTLTGFKIVEVPLDTRHPPLKQAVPDAEEQPEVPRQQPDEEKLDKAFDLPADRIVNDDLFAEHPRDQEDSSTLYNSGVWG